MSRTKRDTNVDIDPESSSDGSNQLTSSATTASCDGSNECGPSTSGSSTDSGSNCNTIECKDSHQLSISGGESNGHVCPEASRTVENLGGQEHTSRCSTVTEESKAPVIKRDDVIKRSQSTTGRKCDTAIRTLKTSCPSSLRLRVRDDEEAKQSTEPASVSPNPCSSTSHQLDISNVERNQTLRLVPAPAPSPLDTNNNRNSAISSARTDNLANARRNNFSKSASGSRLMHRNEPRSKVCDCLSQQCGEKEHSNRRQFIENYYNSRTRLPSSTAMSSLNISTPLNRLSECDAITKRLLSSPIRTVNFSETPNRRAQIGEIDKSRRASLGTNALTEQVSLFSSSQFNSSATNHEKGSGKDTDDNQKACDSLADNVNRSGAASDLRHKQQQARSLSVCQDDCQKRRLRSSGTNHSSHLNRAVSVACESGTPKQMMTIIPLFGCDIRALEQFMRWGLVLPPAIDSAVDHILAHGVNSIGIFRKSGVKSRILNLKQRIEANQEVSFEQINGDNEFSIYDIADLVKMWFRELKPMPIMTKDLIRLISGFLQSSGSWEKLTPSSQYNRLQEGSINKPELHRQSLDCKLKQQIDSTISPTHKALFLKALNFFASISSKSEINQMTSQNLAICLTPSICATESDQNSIIVAQKALKFCIDNYQILL